MRRRLSNLEKGAVAVIAIAPFLAGCSIDSYLNDPSDVQCDGNRTIEDIATNGVARFIVHGLEGQDPATIIVRRSEDGVSVMVEGNVTGPPQQVEEDGFTEPVPEVEGAEISTFGAGGAWIIDVRDDDKAVIQGSCQGL